MAHGGGGVGNTLVTNGATLEDCHTNVFVLTELTGLKWCRYTAGHMDVNICTDICEDPIFKAYSECLKRDLLCVWRRVSVPSPNSSSTHPSFPTTVPPMAATKVDLRLAAEKELWVFWYGEEQPAILKTVCATLTKADEASWDKGVEYETRLLLFKALHNRIERSLLESEYVRLGKWFVLPLSAEEASHPPKFLLAFNFSFFIHGENNVCVSVTVQRQPPISRLSRAHIAKRETGLAQKVLLAPFCVAASLSRQCHINLDADSQATKIWREWLDFYPLPELDTTENMGYVDAAEKERQDQLRALAPPEMVEVVVGGVRLKYPTAYVLVECECTSSTARGNDTAAGGEKREQSNMSKLADGLATAVQSSPVFSGLFLQRAAEELATSGTSLAAVNARRASQNDRSTPTSELQQQQQLPNDETGLWGFSDSSEKDPCHCCRPVGTSTAPPKSNSPLPVLNKAQLKFGYTSSNSASSSGVSGQSVNGHRQHKLSERHNRIGKSGPFHRRHLVPRAGTASGSGGSGRSSSPPIPQQQSEPENAPGERVPATSVAPVVATTSSSSAPNPGHVMPSAAPTSSSCAVENHVPATTPSLSSPSSSTIRTTAACPTATSSFTCDSVTSSIKHPPIQTTTTWRCPFGKRKPYPLPRHEKRIWKRPRLSTTGRNGGEEGLVLFGPGLICPSDELNPVTPSCNDLTLSAQDWCAQKVRKRELVNSDPFTTPDIPAVLSDYSRPPVSLFPRSPTQLMVPSQQLPQRGMLAPMLESGSGPPNSGQCAPAPVSPAPVSGQGAVTNNNKTSGGVNLPENIMEDSPTDMSNEFLSPPPSHGHDDETGGQHSSSNTAPRTISNHNPNVSSMLSSRSRIDYNMIYPTPPSIEAPPVYGHGQFSPEAAAVMVTALPVQRPTSPGPHNPIHSMINGEITTCDSLSFKGTINCRPTTTFAASKSVISITEQADHPQKTAAIVDTDLVAKYLLADAYSPQRLSNEKNTFPLVRPKVVPSLPIWRKSDQIRRPQIMTSRFPMTPSAAIIRPPSPMPFPYPSPAAHLQHNSPGSPVPALPPPPPYGIQRCWPSPAAIGSPFNIRPRTPVSAGCIYDIQSPVSAGSSLCLRNENSVEAATMISHTPGSALSTGEGLPTPEGHSLVLSLLLCDSVANLYRDSSFDSCPLCVCSMGIMGVDAGLYLVVSSAAIAARQSANCSIQNSLRCNCGFSAVRYRYLNWRAGLFYEDEHEATGVWPSNDGFYPHQRGGRRSSAFEFATLIRYKAGADPITNCSTSTFDLSGITAQANRDFITASYVRPVIELRDLTEMCNLAVEQACMMMDCTKPSRDDLRSIMTSSGMIGLPDQTGLSSNKYMADWGYMKATHQATNSEACFVMRVLAPILQESMQKSRGIGGGSMQVTKQAHGSTVEGPLSWRQLHRKCLHRTTNDLSGPEPVPLLLLATEHDWVTISPFALRTWDRLPLEPYGQQKDIVYIAMVPDTPVVVQKSRQFFRSLSKAYEGLRLGRHCPVPRVFKDGIMPIKKNYAKQLSQASLDSSSIDPYFDQIADRFPSLGSKLKLCGQICRHYLSSYLMAENVFDKSVFRDIGKEGASSESMPPPSLIPGAKDSQDQSASATSASAPDADGGEGNDMESSPVPHVVVIYFVDAFTFGPANRENEQFRRAAAESWLRCYLEVLRDLPDAEKARVQVEIIPLEYILETVLTDAVGTSSQAGYLRQLALSVFKQPRWLDFNSLSSTVAKPLTGFGTAAARLELIRRKTTQQRDGANYGTYYQAYCPPVTLAPAFDKATVGPSPDSHDDSCRVLFISYCLSENQDWLLATATDHQGCLLEDCIIDLRVDSRRCVIRRPVSSACGASMDSGPDGSMIWASLRKLWNFVTSCLATATHPWRLVIGRLGRIGHEELKAWGHFLCRTKLRATSRLIRERCGMCSNLPAFYDTSVILSACLISTEPDPSLRLFPNSFSHDDRFGQGGKHCPLSTPEDVSCTHIMVFPTSATIHMSQSAIPGGGPGGGEDDADPLDLGDFFLGVEVDELFGGGMNGDEIMDEPGKPFQHQQGLADIGDESIQLQPLALGYLISTAPSGWFPDWFWTNRPSGRSEVPTHLRSALHIHTSGVQQNDEQLLPTSSSAGGGYGSGGSKNAANVHMLDSSLTTDVLRYVLETYNSLSWLTLDAQRGDRRTCMPVHIDHLCRLYRAINEFNPPPAAPNL